MKKVNSIFKVFLAFCLSLLITQISISYADNTAPADNSNIINTIEKNAPNLNPKVLKLALEAYQHANKLGMDDQSILTVVDYTLPSSQKRLWVINVKTGNVLFHTLVAHGRNSGANYPNHFSDKQHSHASSIGVFLTGDTYDGKHGFSLRLYGLDKGYNNHAYARDIVMHSAWYVSPSFVKSHGRLGRSWGCLALNKNIANNLINTVKDGSIILSYYPNSDWSELATNFTNTAVSA